MTVSSDGNDDDAHTEYTGVVPSHRPESIDAEIVRASHRIEVTGRWKLDLEAGEAREVAVDDMPGKMYERLSAVFTDAGSDGDGGASEETSDDVAGDLKDRDCR